MDDGAYANVDHARATELFSAYWDEDLAPDELGALEEHLKSCVVCRREYQTFEKTVGAIGAAAHDDGAARTSPRACARASASGHAAASSRPEEWPSASPTSSSRWSCSA